MNCMHRDEKNKPGGGNDVEDDGMAYAHSDAGGGGEEANDGSR